MLAKIAGAVFAPLVLVRIAAARRHRRDLVRRRVETGLVVS